MELGTGTSPGKGTWSWGQVLLREKVPVPKFRFEPTVFWECGIAGSAPKAKLKPQKVKEQDLAPKTIEDVDWTYQGYVAAKEMARNLSWITLSEIEDAPAQGGEDVRGDRHCLRARDTHRFHLQVEMQTEPVPEDAGMKSDVGPICVSSSFETVSARLP